MNDGSRAPPLVSHGAQAVNINTRHDVTTTEEGASMIRKLLLIVLVALPVVAQKPPRYIIDDTHPATEVMRRLGVTAYRFASGAGGVPTHVELLDRQDARVGSFDTRLLRDGSREIQYQPEAADRFTVNWNGHVLELRTTAGTYTLGYDENSKKAIASEGASEAFEARRKDLVALAETIGELHKQGALSHRIVSNCMVDCGPPDDGGGYDPFLSDPTIGGGGGQNCSGPWLRGSVTSADIDISSVRSIMCAEAERRVNVACDNQYCLGCCRVLPCDGFCVMGDYFCPMVGVSGEACSR